MNPNNPNDTIDMMEPKSVVVSVPFVVPFVVPLVELFELEDAEHPEHLLVAAFQVYVNADLE
jgi:hypothetical protein